MKCKKKKKIGKKSRFYVNELDRNETLPGAKECATHWFSMFTTKERKKETVSISQPVIMIKWNWKTYQVKPNGVESIQDSSEVNCIALHFIQHHRHDTDSISSMTNVQFFAIGLAQVNEKSEAKIILFIHHLHTQTLMNFACEASTYQFLLEKVLKSEWNKLKSRYFIRLSSKKA